MSAHSSFTKAPITVTDSLRLDLHAFLRAEVTGDTSPGCLSYHCYLRNSQPANRLRGVLVVKSLLRHA
jgi:hypothetical protein